MANQATPNLPSRDFEVTEAFYSRLGFEVSYRAEGWMILENGAICLEFFPYPDLDPANSSFGSCLRLDDVDTFFQTCQKAGIPQQQTGFPRIHAPKLEQSGMVIGYLLDPDGSLLRLVQNPD
ncbi:bleomycin resistance protein [Sphingorhabdus arenilitoris]|uniref:Bleomycin resistance protein n=1 Tax=Sphingorhabdus arenilitoris TaxID=1490041 RepID=A0ABV8RFW8_9SPHN